MTNTRDEQLRATFNEDADLYNRGRPRYPLQLFKDLVALTDISSQSRILEIGPGTGLATVPIAKLQSTIIGVELGANMAAVARRNLSQFPNVEIVVSAFEDWPLPSEKFDLVMAATAFHWIREDIRINKCADALRSGGFLAVISTHHVDGGSKQFFTDVQRIYDHYGIGEAPGFCLAAASDIPEQFDEAERSGLFDSLQFRRYEWDEIYTAQSYLDLLATYSNHRALSTQAQAEMFPSIANLITSRYGGQITKRYMVQLAVARKRSDKGSD